MQRSASTGKTRFRSGLLKLSLVDVCLKTMPNRLHAHTHNITCTHTSALMKNGRLICTDGVGSYFENTRATQIDHTINVWDSLPRIIVVIVIEILEGARRRGESLER